MLAKQTVSIWAAGEEKHHAKGKEILSEQTRCISAVNGVLILPSDKKKKALSFVIVVVVGGGGGGGWVGGWVYSFFILVKK